MITEAGHPPAQPLAELTADRLLLVRASTAEGVADILRDRITEGFLRPGTALSQEKLQTALGVSRNTLREAFHLLLRERLVVRQPNRSVSVRVLTSSDLDDLLRLQLLVERGTLHSIGPPPYDLAAVRSAVLTGERSAAEGVWRECRGADARFHEAVALFSESPRTEELVRGVLAELQLAFQVIEEHALFNERGLTAKRKILSALTSGDGPQAEHLLSSHLAASRRQLVAAYGSAYV